MNSVNLAILGIAVVVCWIGTIEAGPLRDVSNDVQLSVKCQNLCGHCGCVGYYCGDECICDCNQDDIDVTCVETMHSNCQKLQLPFEVLIQGPSGNRFVRKLVGDKDTKRPAEGTPYIRRARSTVSIYQPDAVEGETKVEASEVTNEATVPAASTSDPTQSVIASLSQNEGERSTVATPEKSEGEEEEGTTMPTSTASESDGKEPTSESLSPAKRETKQRASKKRETTDDQNDDDDDDGGSQRATQQSDADDDDDDDDDSQSARQASDAENNDDDDGGSQSARQQSETDDDDDDNSQTDRQASDADDEEAPVRQDQNNDDDEAPVRQDQNNDDEEAPVRRNQNNDEDDAPVRQDQNNDEDDAPVAQDRNNDDDDGKEPQVGSAFGLGLPLLPLFPLKIGKLSLLGAALPDLKAKIELKHIQAEAAKHLKLAHLGVQKHLAESKLASAHLAAKAAIDSNLRAFKAAKLPLLPIIL